MNQELLFSGVTTALITPFNKDNTIDLQSLSSLLNKQINAKVSGVVICGSTGEASSLSEDEFELVSEHCINFVKKKQVDTKVIVSLSSNNLDICIKRAKFAESRKADGILAVSPYYFKTSQDGMIKYFTQIANSTKLPIILYNVPSRTASDLSSKTIAKLAKINNIVGIKDATGQLDRVCELKNELILNKIDLKTFSIISGEDKTFADFCALGGCGVISVISNVLPKQMNDLYYECKNCNWEKAFQVQASMYNFIDSIFALPNPVGIKLALSINGISQNKLRLPLLEVDKDHSLEKLKNEMEKLLNS